MSEPIHILITLPISDKQLAQVEQVSDRFSVTRLPALEASEVPPEVWEQTEVLYTMYTLPTPEQAPHLTWVQAYLAGVDKLREAEIFKKEGIRLTTASGANASQVAEHIVTMLMALGHQLPEIFQLQTRAEWMTDKGVRYIPRELRDSTVGIIGYGSIGRQVARLVHAFGAKVLATKRDVKQPEDRGYIPENMGDREGDYFTRLYPPEALRSMLKECDFVVVTVPLTEHTQGLVGAAQIAAMKSGAFLVDTSRGGVVDQAALVAALNSGHLGGAALDVFEQEPLPVDHPLWQLPNVILTPHIAGFSPAYNARANELFVENLYRYVAKDPLLNTVDLKQGY